MLKPLEIVVNVSAERAWVALGDHFGETGQWTSKLSSSYMVGQVDVGASRVCMDGNQKLTETLTRFDPVNKVLSYALTEGGPKHILKSAVNTWSVKSLGPDRALVTMSPMMELVWWAVPLAPIMNAFLTLTMRVVGEECKYWVETGDRHPRKKARDAKMKNQHKAVG